jgi:hypothetical protein
MSSKRPKGKEARQSLHGGSHKAVMTTKKATKSAGKAAPKRAMKTNVAVKAVAKPSIKAATSKPATKLVVKSEPAKAVVKAATKPTLAPKPGLKAALSSAAVIKPVLKEERVHSHPTMCLHCHLIVEMFHERGADPVKGAWQCPRCGHKYLFSHWKIKRQARGKPEAA